MQKLYTKQNETGRWHFGAPSILRPGTISWSINTWSTKAQAKHAGRQEFSGRKIKWFAF